MGKNMYFWSMGSIDLYTLRSTYNCFKLLGLDILLDSQLHPWVLEVNSDPVLHPDSVDFPVKSKLIPEMFNILGLHIPQVEETWNNIKNSKNLRNLQ